MRRPALSLAGEKGEPAALLLCDGPRAAARSADLGLGPAAFGATPRGSPARVRAPRRIIECEAGEHSPRGGGGVTCPASSRGSPRRCDRWRRALLRPRG